MMSHNLPEKFVGKIRRIVGQHPATGKIIFASANQ